MGGIDDYGSYISYFRREILEPADWHLIVIPRELDICIGLFGPVSKKSRTFIMYILLLYCIRKSGVKVDGLISRQGSGLSR